MLRIASFLWILALVATPSMTFGQQPVKEVRDSLNRTIQEVEEASARERELQKQQSKIQKELTGLQEELVRLTGNIKSQEKALLRLLAHLAYCKRKQRTGSV